MIQAVELEIFGNLLMAAAEQMGHTLMRTAHSANIKERRDFSCALLTAGGELLAQAAHIPVHLGSMADSVAAAMRRHQLQPGDVVILNDPYCGGTHLPDLTMITPIFVDDRLFAVAANRAHHADMGGSGPGSLAPARSIFEEGFRIPPVKWFEGTAENRAVRDLLLANVRTPRERIGDLHAQLAANAVGARAFQQILDRYGSDTIRQRCAAVLDYAERLMRSAIAALPDGDFPFDDQLDDDGIARAPVRIAAVLQIRGQEAVVDFSGSAAQVAGCVNCPLAVTRSAVYYVFNCLAGEGLPHNGGAFRPLRVIAPEGSVLNARPPAAVVAGNVETSQRIVDVVLGALAQALPDRIPAAASGTMNNLSLGGIDPRTGRPFAYYETIAGGMGARPGRDGVDAVHTHMTNTLNTPAEALEMAYPLRVRRYEVAHGTGGGGRFRGGCGIIREIEALADAEGTLLADRRRSRPYGLAGGQPGTAGATCLIRADGTTCDLPAKARFYLKKGDRIRLQTPGGGGHGRAPQR